eukprot:evm.model.scf_1442.1 EVM.evm.TU.scf_1442.1   scf_1442:4088-4602(-)
MDVPEMFYRATVVRVDSRRRDSVVVRFHEDGSRYWLPLKDVQKWAKESYPLRASCTGKATDEFAASVLMEMCRTPPDERPIQGPRCCSTAPGMAKVVS